MNLTPAQIDALKELINIGVGRAAGMLNQMVQSRISLQVPFIRIFSPEDSIEEIDGLSKDRLATVRLSFKGHFSGTAVLGFPTESALKLVAVLTDEKPGTSDIDTVSAATLNEVGNIVINGVMGSISNVLKTRIEYSVPNYAEDTVLDLLRPGDSDTNSTVLLAKTRFVIEEFEIEGDIILLFEVGSFDILLRAIDAMRSDSGE